MELTSLLKEKQLSVYQCAKESGVPYTNLLDIVKGKTRIEKCTAETLFPRDVILAAKLDASLDMKEQCLKEAIPEFMRFNIVESEIRNVF